MLIVKKSAAQDVPAVLDSFTSTKIQIMFETVEIKFSAP